MWSLISFININEFSLKEKKLSPYNFCVTNADNILLSDRVDFSRIAEIVTC